MVKFVVLLLFVGALAFTPVWLFDSMVMPELFSLKAFYGSTEATAQHIVDEAK